MSGKISPSNNCFSFHLLPKRKEKRKRYGKPSRIATAGEARSKRISGPILEIPLAHITSATAGGKVGHVCIVHDVFHETGIFQTHTREKS